jgi:hypothetical protein
VNTSHSIHLEALKGCKAAAKAANTHTGKLIVFSDLLKQNFGLDSYEIVPNVEQYVKTGGLIALKDVWTCASVRQ